jgi:glycosyltransferase involved in cell wall biosynthesis
MNILYVVTLYSTYNQFFESHLKVLVDNGHEVHLACSMNIEDVNFNESIKFHDVPFKRSILKNNFFSIRNKLTDIVNLNDIDIVHVQTPIASAITRLLLPRNKTFKLFYTAHGFHFHRYAPLKNWMFFIVEWVLSFRTDKLILTNQWDYKIASKFFQCKDILLSNGVGLRSRDSLIEFDIRNELGIHKDDFVLINVAEHNKNKNQMVLLKIVKELKEHNIHLILVGQGVLTGKYKRFIAKHRLNSQIHILGYRNDVFNLLNNSNLFVFPSRREGLGMALIEALNQKRHFIAYKIRGIEDICEDKYDQNLIRPYSYVDFKNKVLQEYLKFKDSPDDYFCDYQDLNLQRFSMSDALKFVVKQYE